MQVPLGHREIHLRPRGRVRVDDRADQSVVERGVGDHVDGGRPAGQYPVLDAQLRAPGLDVVDRTVPAPHCAVVQPKLTQARHASRFKGGIGILGVQRRKQRRKQPYEVVKELHGVVDPAVAKPDAGRAIKSETADTPAKLVYLAVQLMYISPNPEANHGTYFNLVREIVTAAPSTWPIIEGINNDILNGDLYHALKEAKKLVAYEKSLLELNQAQTGKNNADVSAVTGERRTA